jgi:SET domain-containing protein
MNDRPRLVRRRSRIEGFGVFAEGTIVKGVRVVEYKGELISQAEGGRREARYLPRGRIWIFNVNRRWVRDAGVGGNIARYINHVCHPNCSVEIDGRTIWIRAARRIEKGEELTYDYNTDGSAGIECRCSPHCRRVL